MPNVPRVSGGEPTTACPSMSSDDTGTVTKGDVSRRYNGRALPTNEMLDYKWGIDRILNILEICNRVDLICEQCLAFGFNFGVETIVSANYLREVFNVGRLPPDTDVRLRAAGFLFTEQGEIMCCLSN